MCWRATNCEKTPTGIFVDFSGIRIFKSDILFDPEKSLIREQSLSFHILNKYTYNCIVAEDACATKDLMFKGQTITASDGSRILYGGVICPVRQSNFNQGNHRKHGLILCQL